MGYNSTIKRKYCKCSEGCKKMPSMGFGGYYYSHAPQEIKDAKGLKAKRGYQNSLSKARSNALAKKVGNYQREKERSPMSLKMLLAEADSKFSHWIRERDAVLGKIKCPCCGGIFGVKDKTPDGGMVVQVLHFVSRMVFSKRYSEINKAGCCYCNLKMHLDSKGVEYQNYRALLVKELDEFTVSQIESDKYRINRITHSQLEDIIKKYSK